jgi:hypothetical protein
VNPGNLVMHNCSRRSNHPRCCIMWSDLRWLVAARTWHFYDISDTHIQVQILLCFFFWRRVYWIFIFAETLYLCYILRKKEKKNYTSVTNTCLLFGSSGLGNCWFQTSGLPWILGVYDRYAGWHCSVSFLPLHMWICSCNWSYVKTLNGWECAAGFSGTGRARDQSRHPFTCR